MKVCFVHVGAAVRRQLFNWRQQLIRHLRLLNGVLLPIQVAEWSTRLLAVCWYPTDVRACYSRSHDDINNHLSPIRISTNGVRRIAPVNIDCKARDFVQWIDSH